jgi:hypothetical protein
MRIGAAAIPGALLLLAAGCRPETKIGPGGAPKAFLDEKKDLPPRLMWSREVIAKTGGQVTFRVASQGPFAVTVVTEKGHKALQGGDRQAVEKADLMFAADSKGEPHEGRVTLPAGSSFFVVENRSDRNVQVHLQCFPPG